MPWLELVLAVAALGSASALAVGGFRSKQKDSLIGVQEKLLTARALEATDYERRLARLEAKVGVLEQEFAERIADRVVARLEQQRMWVGG